MTTLARRDRALVVLIVSGAFGFRVGLVGFPDWQVAVETAQVVARVVHYPSATPFYVYHTKLWTILHQLLAIGLRFGMSEIRLSLVVSGLLGMISFQALSMFVYALSRDTLLAIGAAFLIFFSRSGDIGGAYPIYLMGTSHTYGVIGLSLCVLVVGLLGAGCYRTGAFLAGVAPSVHPSLGAWLLLILAICFAWDYRNLKRELRPGFRWFLIGCGVTVVSFGVQTALITDAPRIDARLAQMYLAEWVRLWDVHRQPIALGAHGQIGAVALNCGALSLALIWLFGLSAALTRSAVLLLRTVIVAAVLSLVFVFVSWIPAERLPVDFLILMPTRLLNFNAMIAVALLLGLIGAYDRTIWSTLLTSSLAICLMFGTRSMLWTSLEARRVLWRGWMGSYMVVAIIAFGLVVLAWTTWTRRRGATEASASAQSWTKPILTAGRLISLATLLLAGVLTWRISTPTSLSLLDRTNSPLFKIASEGKGILLTGANLHLIQLRTRRPVLVDGGGLDGLPYALEAAPQTERILQDVYGLDFFHPPEEARRSGTIPRAATKTIWEQFSVQKWREIGRTYGVTEVVTWVDWTLDLPVLAQDREFRLYQIPR